METILYIIVVLVRLILYAEMACMFIRMIFSWIMPDSEGGFIDLLYYLTEPVIAPVRALLYRIPAIAELPIDISFVVTWLILSIIVLFI